MTELNKTFQCTIISPAGKLLDCQAVGVTFVAHDGSVGILSNHMPMLCELGLGMMKIQSAGGNAMNTIAEKFALIDGGFALVHSNVLQIIATDAISGADMKKEKIEIILENNRKKLKDIPEGSEMYSHQVKKNAYLEHLLSEQK